MCSLRKTKFLPPQISVRRVLLCRFFTREINCALTAYLLLYIIVWLSKYILKEYAHEIL